MPTKSTTRGTIAPAVIPPGLTPHEVVRLLRAAGYVVSDTWTILGERGTTAVGDCHTFTSIDGGKQRLTHRYIGTIDASNVATFTREAVSETPAQARVRESHLRGTVYA